MSRRVIYYAGEPELSNGKAFFPIKKSFYVVLPFVGTQLVTKVVDYCKSRQEAADLVDELNKKGFDPEDQTRANV